LLRAAKRLYTVTLNWGERDVDAGTAAMLVNIGPILPALLGGLGWPPGCPCRSAVPYWTALCSQ
jgi:hypothetical protein